MIESEIPSDSLRTSRFHTPNFGCIARAAIAAHANHASGRTFITRKIVWHRNATATAKSVVCSNTNARVLNALNHKTNGPPTGRSVNQNDGLNGPSLATFRYDAESGKKDGNPFFHPGPSTRTRYSKTANVKTVSERSVCRQRTHQLRIKVVVLFGKHQIPPIETIATFIRHDVARKPQSVLGRI